MNKHQNLLLPKSTELQKMEKHCLLNNVAQQNFVPYSILRDIFKYWLFKQL